jgi:hypothetical protein
VLAPATDARAQLLFASLNALAGLIWLIAAFALIDLRYWALDAAAISLASLEWLSALALYLRLSWALRALRVAAWLTFAVGLVVVALVVLTMTFLRTVHGEDGAAASLLSGLVVALIVPYALVLPVAQLLWLGRRRDEALG